jgi:hypothetical protein
MKKKPTKRIALHRETLRILEEPGLLQVEGGATNQRTVCGSCPPSACHPTLCAC